MPALNILPPTYYYFITFLYYLFRNETAVSFAFCLIGIFSLILIFLLTKKISSVKTGLLTLLIYASSYKMVEYSRSFWEPHSIPFFILLSFYFLYTVFLKKKFIFLFLSIFFFFMSLMYVSSFLLLPSFFILTIFVASLLDYKKKNSIIATIFTFILFSIIFYGPILYFESKHNFYTWGTLPSILTGKTHIFIFDNLLLFYNSLNNHLGIFAKSIFLYDNLHLNFVLLRTIMLISIILIFVRSCHNKNLALFILFPFFSGIFFTGFYQDKPLEHRLASLYPFFFILFSYSMAKIINFLTNQKILYKIWVVFPFTILYIFLNNNISSAKFFIFNLSPATLHQFKTADYINHYAKNETFSLYVITPEETENYYSPEYWYALEKLRKTRLIDLNEEGNYIKKTLKINSRYIFLICKDFESRLDIMNKCYKYFVRQENLTIPITVEKIDEALIFIFKTKLPSNLQG